MMTIGQHTVNSELTVGHIELLSGLFAEYRQEIQKEIYALAEHENDLMAAARVTITLADVMARLTAQGKLAYFLAVLTEGGTLQEREKAMKKASYAEAEKVLRFFFQQNIVSSLFIPGYLIPQMPDQSETATPGEKS